MFNEGEMDDIQKALKFYLFYIECERNKAFDPMNAAVRVVESIRVEGIMNKLFSILSAKRYASKTTESLNLNKISSLKLYKAISRKQKKEITELKKQLTEQENKVWECRMYIIETSAKFDEIVSKNTGLRRIDHTEESMRFFDIIDNYGMKQLKKTGL